MANISLIAKRTAVSSAWNLFIYSATGEYPIMRSEPNAVYIDFKPGQDKKFREYLDEAISAKNTEDSLNVHVNLKPVAAPLILKHGGLPVAGFTVAIIALTKLLWK